MYFFSSNFFSTCSVCSIFTCHAIDPINCYNIWLLEVFNEFIITQNAKDIDTRQHCVSLTCDSDDNMSKFVRCRTSCECVVWHTDVCARASQAKTGSIIFALTTRRKAFPPVFFCLGRGRRRDALLIKHLYSSNTKKLSRPVAQRQNSATKVSNTIVILVATNIIICLRSTTVIITVTL